jgi:protein-arginine kinase activator protein McsA
MATFIFFGLEEINKEELMVGEECAGKHIYLDSSRLNKSDESKIILRSI